ncbi:MAG: hypothetical protein CFE28_03510 [Alphaproteobacteria bacterium PA2]|nr:MAG: hypothetical protein CFE28_03510 [Alphaproteobacteria bacterium PA2]
MIAPVFGRALYAIQRNRMMDFFASPSDATSAQLLSGGLGGHSTYVLFDTLLESLCDSKSCH